MYQHLPGGRTNSSWKISWRDGTDAVLKLYREGADTPLFRNDPQAEWNALIALRQTGLAPHALSRGKDRLVYRFVEGLTGAARAATVAELLKKLHAQNPPKGLPQAPESLGALHTQGMEMLANCKDRSLAELRPVLNDIKLAPNVFLHGDPVAGNIIATPAGAVLIDWQCPAWGDPIFDLYLAASPGMQAIYGGDICLNALLDAYADPAVKARMQVALSGLQWRMAVYGQWKLERGDADYKAVRDAETDALKKQISL